MKKILIVRMKNEREINKKDVFSTLKPFKLMPVADLGGQMGATAPPFTMKIQLWRPLFGKKSTPYPDPNALFFQ